MSSTMKVSLLALVASVAAVPNYGHGHSKFHVKPTGEGKPYPSGGWGSWNSTQVAQPTAYGNDKTTVDVTSTSTTTLYTTVTLKASPAPGASNPVVVENVSAPVGGQCGPATVTVTASEKVTVTVTPGGGADAPKSSVVVKSEGNGYPVNQGTTTSTVFSTTKVEETRTTKVPQVPYSKPQAPSSQAVPAPSSQAVYKPSSAAPVVSSAVVSSAAPSKTPSSGNSYTGSKRGLAYNEASLCKSFGGKFGFGYNWGQVESNDIGAPFIPMMHKPTDSTAAEWQSNVNKAVGKGTKAVMGFNEPDHPEQANMPDVSVACNKWKEYMNPLASAHPELTIIGPSVTNGPAPMGLDWLSRFHTQCPDAVVHATNIHFYDIYNEGTLGRFQKQVEQAASLYGKPVWVTEFGLNSGSATQEQAASFLKDAMAYLDGSDKVQGYSWFMVGSGENQLNLGNGLSPVGKVYASY